MKMIVITFLSIMLAILPAAKQSDKQNATEDPYDIVSVRTLISLAQARPVVQIGSAEKHNNALGDKAAVAIIKIYNEGDLINPANVKGYLPVIRAAFEFPKLIVQKDDRDPKATLLLLHYVGANLKDASLKKEVADLVAQLSKRPSTPALP